MMMGSMRLFAAAAIALVSFTNVAEAAPKVKGMAFSTGHDLYGYRQKYADQSLNQLKATGANYVHISAYATMPGINALTSKPVTDVASVRYIIRKVRRKGMKVFFKPVIEINRKWRGFIPGSPAWFNMVYRPFILKWAKVAQEEGVQLFAVGSEYAATDAKTAEWTKVISAVKKVYKRDLVYVANHDSYRKVKFFKQVTYIGISAYFPLLTGKRGRSPNLAKTKALWNARAREIYEWRMKNGLGSKKVLLGETGAQSKGDEVVYRVPWEYQVKAPVNFNEQRKMYEGILGAFMPKSWCAGVMLWKWELKPNAGRSDPTNKDYTPQNKPALAVMKKYYKRRY